MINGKPISVILLGFFLLTTIFFHCNVFAESFESVAVYENEKDFGSDFEDEFENFTVEQIFDPLSCYNRFMTQANDKFYLFLLKPLAKGYSWIVPESGRLAVNRFFNNVLFPVRLVNNFLQFKFKRSGIEIARFGINSTIGILGFADPANRWLKLDAYPEDFGQTLGHYGVKSYFHIVLPLLGPSNVRDVIGMVPDYFLNPVHYLECQEAIYGIRSFDKMNYTSLHIDDYESLKKDAVDLYILLRDIYEQNRKAKIKE